MKSNAFNYSILAVGVAALMGVSTGAMAAETNNDAQTGVAIANTATANYNVGGVAQPSVESNEVIVNINETPNFSLVSNITDGDNDPDTAINQEATPGGSTLFTHLLTNEGNITDTYTIATNATDTSIGGTPDYTFDSTEVSYSINVSELTTEQLEELKTLNPNTNYSVSGTTASGTLTTTNDELTLLPGLVAELSYNAPTGADQEGGDTGEGTLTATSSVITGQPTLTNENQTIVKLPVFKIEKSATCQSKTNCNSFDLNGDTTSGIDYSIKVTNVSTDYSVTADNFVIRDVLPAGMTFNTNQTLPDGVSIDTAGMQGNRQVIDITVPSLTVGASVKVDFNVNVDVPTLTDAGSATNHATVYDNYDDTTPNPDATDGFDISDSTDDIIDSPNVPEDADGSETDGKDTTPTITFTDRDLTISSGTTEEVPVQGEVTYSHTITNNGNENEGGTDRPITITLTDPDTGNALSIDKTTNVPYYSTDGGTTKLPLVDNGDGDGTYQLPDDVILVPNTAADGETPTTGSTVEIGYTVVSDGTNDDIDVTNETNEVILTPTVENGIESPATTVTNTTEIQGLKLVKLAAVVAGTDSSLTCPTGSGLDSLTFSDGTTTAINAEPFDCIVYEITATNTFTTKGLSNVTVSDDKTQWNTQASYQDDVAGLIDGSATGVTDNDTGDFITSTFVTLPAEGTGTMTFSIKVNP